MQHTRNINVLYVDDEEHNLTSFKASFRRIFNIHVAGSVKEAEQILLQQRIHVLITDQKMPEKTGVDMLAETAKRFPHQTRILLTSFGDREVLIDAINRGHIYMFLEKPLNKEHLEQAIITGNAHFFEKRNYEKKIRKLVRENRAMKRILGKRRYM